MVAVKRGYRIKEVSLVKCAVMKELWGFFICLDTPNGEVKFIAQGNHLQAWNGRVTPTNKKVLKLQDLQDVPDYTEKAQFLRDIFARRFFVPRAMVIPFDVMAKLCEVRYRKKYHVYQGFPGHQVRAVVAPRGSGITGLQFSPQNGGTILFERRNQPPQPLTDPYVLFTEDNAEVNGFTVSAAHHDRVVFTGADVPTIDAGEMEYLLSHALV